MTRPTYDDLPTQLRSWVAGVLSAPVVAAVDEPGGYSPGVAARVRCASGRLAFVKAVSAEVNSFTVAMHRQEARVTSVLPTALGSPRLLGCYDQDPWVALVLEQVDGRPPARPWSPAELTGALRALDRLSQVGAPEVVPGADDVLAEEFGGWARLAHDPSAGLGAWERRHLDRLVELEHDWASAVAGDGLVHLDARADNMLVRADGDVVLVDWPWAGRGAAVMDVVGFVPDAVLRGGGDPDELLLATVAGRRSDPAVVTVLVAAFAGMLADARRRPPRPEMPTLRAFQAAQGDVALSWLGQRTGWR